MSCPSCRAATRHRSLRPRKPAHHHGHGAQHRAGCCGSWRTSTSASPRSRSGSSPSSTSPSATLQKQLADIVLDLCDEGREAGRLQPKAQPPASRTHIAKIVAVDRPNTLVIVGTERGRTTGPWISSGEWTCPRRARARSTWCRSSTPTRRRSRPPSPRPSVGFGKASAQVGRADQGGPRQQRGRARGAPVKISAGGDDQLAHHRQQRARLRRRPRGHLQARPSLIVRSTSRPSSPWTSR